MSVSPESRGPCTERMLLGDTVHVALATAGVTPDVVRRWLGFPCGCDERRRRLNSLDRWVRRVLSGKGMKEDLSQHLREMTSEE